MPLLLTSYNIQANATIFGKIQAFPNFVKLIGQPWQVHKSLRGDLLSFLSFSGWTAAVWSQIPSLMSRVRRRAKRSPLEWCDAFIFCPLSIINTYVPHDRELLSHRMKSAWKLREVFEVIWNNKRLTGGKSGGRRERVWTALSSCLQSCPLYFLH